MSGTNNWYQRLGTNAQKPRTIIVNELLTFGDALVGGRLSGEAPVGDRLPGRNPGAADLPGERSDSGLRFTNDQVSTSRSSSSAASRSTSARGNAEQLNQASSFQLPASRNGTLGWKPVAGS
jgi:hypothetical protein